MQRKTVLILGFAVFILTCGAASFAASTETDAKTQGGKPDYSGTIHVTLGEGTQLQPGELIQAQPAVPVKAKKKTKAKARVYERTRN